MARPATTEIQVNSGNEINVARYKAEMARESNKRYFLEHSGDLANTTEIHRLMRPVLYAMHDGGLDCGLGLTLLDETSRLSPDKDGVSRKEAMQLMEEGAVIIPGVGTFGGRQPEPEPSWFQRQKQRIFGGPK